MNQNRSKFSEKALVMENPRHGKSCFERVLDMFFLVTCITNRTGNGQGTTEKDLVMESVRAVSPGASIFRHNEGSLVRIYRDYYGVF